MAYEFFDRSEWTSYRPQYTGPAALWNQGVLHHTADASDPGEFDVMPKPGPKWYRQYRNNRASAAVRKAIAAYEADRSDVIAREKKAMRAMEAYHRSKGWACIGYHRVIFPSGHVYGGRPFKWVGAHAKGGNHKTGYSFAGNFDVQKPTSAALASFRYQMQKDGVGSFVGHFQVPGNATACPGRYLKERFDLY